MGAHQGIGDPGVSDPGLQEILLFGLGVHDAEVGQGDEAQSHIEGNGCDHAEQGEEALDEERNEQGEEQGNAPLEAVEL